MGDRYGVPAKRGAKVRLTQYSGSGGTVSVDHASITSAIDGSLRVKLDKTGKRQIWHPTWQVEYLNGTRWIRAPGEDDPRMQYAVC